MDARYNPHFVVTKEDIDALIPKVELLRDITKRICEAKIKEYGGAEWYIDTSTLSIVVLFCIYWK